ncbi:MAG: molybdopterin-dependent oxidoreductase [Chloroflexi bacterium]|nr:molybdopterin-dependent oxidoreductase [Chloroflexota bacterium]
MKHGFAAGVAAAVVSGLPIALARYLFGVPTPPEVLVDLVTALLPTPVFGFLVGLLGGWGKPLLVVGLALALLLAGGAIGALWSWLDGRLRGVADQPPPPRRRWVHGLGVAAVLWALAMVVLLPGAGQGLFGSRSGWELPVTWLASALAYGLALVAVVRRRAAPEPEAETAPDRASRRKLLRSLGLAVAGMVLASALGGYFWSVVARSGKRASRRPSGLSPEITPNEDFYSVSKNISDPSVSATDWKLTVDGLVDRPLALSYEQLKSLPPVTQFLTLECISNEVGGDLMGNARWTGVALSTLLKEASVRPGVRKVVLHAADDYSDSITLDKALEPGTVIAYEMNGVALPDGHGFPARLLVPGIYGMKNVKWLTRVELVDYDYQGYWQQRGWSDSAVINTMSRIDTPRDYKNRPGDIDFIGGVAFAGDRGIAQVEVSTDDGRTWSRAEVKEALSPYTWVLWTRARAPQAPGSYLLKVRATDKTGRLQSPEDMEPLPDGATGYHTVVVRIVDEPAPTP